MITIKSNQRKIVFDKIKYQKKALEILKYLDYQDFDLGIFLTTNQTIQKYNKKYRNLDISTDVLSFPYHSNLKAGQCIIVKNCEDKNLGDIIISIPYVFANKKELKGTFEQRMDCMLVHAICHLLGYDHINDNDYLKMNILEKQLLKVISKQ